MERFMFVLQREDGAFYWKGNVSSLYGWDKDFNKAFLFKTVKGAMQRAYLAAPMKFEIKKVIIGLL